MSSCAQRESLIEANSSDGFQKLLDVSLAEIRSCLFNSADFVMQPQEITITKEFNGSTFEVTIPENQRIVVLSEREMMLNGGSIDDKGLYDWNTGKIILNQRWLCIETVYHETLHAVSLPSVRTDVNVKFRDFYEGLTEFYTGFLLAKNYNLCYNNCWKLNSNRPCQFTYPQQTRIWIAFCNCINIKETIPIYFYNNSDNWESLFDSFIGRIKEITNTNFTNILQNSTKRPSWLSFHQECLKHLGSKYEEAYQSSDSILDLNNIIN